MYIISPAFYDVKTIGLIGITDDVSVMEYYRIITNYLQQNSFEKQPFDIAVYCVLVNKDREEELTLFNAIFKLMQNPVKVILICNHELESLVPYINENMIGMSNILQSGTAVSMFFNSRNLKNTLFFRSARSQPVNFFGHLINKDGVKLYSLSEEEEGLIESLRNAESLEEMILQPQFTELKNKLSSLDKWDVNAILVDSKELKQLLNNFETNLPVFYTKDIHVEKAIEKMSAPQNVQRAFNGLFHP